jgi:pyruvate,water dikinase
LEIEAAAPRPFEQDGWLDHELNAFKRSKVDVDEILNKKCVEHEDTLKRLQMLYPRQAMGVVRRIEECAASNRARESVRSEFIRLVWVVRSWARKSGEISGIKDDVFSSQSKNC